MEQEKKLLEVNANHFADMTNFRKKGKSQFWIRDELVRLGYGRETADRVAKEIVSTDQEKQKNKGGKYMIRGASAIIFAILIGFYSNWASSGITFYVMIMSGITGVINLFKGFDFFSGPQG